MLQLRRGHFLIFLVCCNCRRAMGFHWGTPITTIKAPTFLFKILGIFCDGSTDLSDSEKEVAMVKVLEDFYPKLKYLKLEEPENTKANGIIAAIDHAFFCRILLQWGLCHDGGQKRSDSTNERGGECRMDLAHVGSDKRFKEAKDITELLEHFLKPEKANGTRSGGYPVSSAVTKLQSASSVLRNMIDNEGDQLVEIRNEIVDGKLHGHTLCNIIQDQSLAADRARIIQSLLY
ncbi:hypothetical protein MAR_026477, partial [Mya arenaria]